MRLKAGFIPNILEILCLQYTKDNFMWGNTGKLRKLEFWNLSSFPMFGSVWGEKDNFR